MSGGFDLQAWMQPHLVRLEQALSGWVDASAPAGLGEAMRYAVLDGGKRLRPLLVLAAAEAVGAGASEAALRGAFLGELREAGVEHNVVNGGDAFMSFIEIEYK